MTIFLMQDYAGGTRQCYRGKYRAKAQERIRHWREADWPADRFVIVEAKSLAEAHKKAQAIFWERHHGGVA